MAALEGARRDNPVDVSLGVFTLHLVDNTSNNSINSLMPVVLVQGFGG